MFVCQAKAYFEQHPDEAEELAEKVMHHLKVRNVLPRAPQSLSSDDVSTMQGTPAPLGEDLPTDVSDADDSDEYTGEDPTPPHDPEAPSSQG